MFHLQKILKFIAVSYGALYYYNIAICKAGRKNRLELY